MIVHKEYTIKILAPNKLNLCTFFSCHRKGTFAVHIEDDKGKCQAHYDPLCELHVLFAIQESLTEQF